MHLLPMAPSGGASDSSGAARRDGVAERLNPAGLHYRAQAKKILEERFREAVYLAVTNLLLAVVAQRS